MAKPKDSDHAKNIIADLEAKNLQNTVLGLVSKKSFFKLFKKADSDSSVDALLKPTNTPK